MYGGTTMISLDSILCVKPRTWSNEIYTGKIYVTVEIESYSDEYEKLEDKLSRKGIHKTISKIERIQHPFAYGRFLLRKEQLEKRGQTLKPRRKFYSVQNSQLKEAIEYNMDNRRTSSISEISEYSSIGSSSCIIVVKTLPTNSSRKRDSEVYPEYIIHFD